MTVRTFTERHHGGHHAGKLVHVREWLDDKGRTLRFVIFAVTA